MRGLDRKRPLVHAADLSLGARDALKTGAMVTISCAEGEVGRVYEGALPIKATHVDLSEVKRPRTEIMLNLGNPELAFRTAMLPNDGVGLARMEFIISEHIKVHPMALVSPEKVDSAQARQEILELVRNYPRPSDYFIEKLSEGVGMIGAAFYPKPVIVRLSDFKTNEYARLLGGATESEHRVLFFRLEALAAQEPRVFVGLEVGKPDNHRLGIERRPDHADAFGQLLDKVIRRPRVVANELKDFLPRLCRVDLLRTDQRHRMDLDVLADDEFHPRQADAIVGEHRRPEGQLGIAEVQHDLGARALDLA